MSHCTMYRSTGEGTQICPRDGIFCTRWWISSALTSCLHLGEGVNNEFEGSVLTGALIQHITQKGFRNNLGNVHREVLKNARMPLSAR